MTHRKQANYFYSINNAQGNIVNGFDEVAKVLTNFYKELLEEQTEERTPILQSIIDQGPVLSTELQLALCKTITNQERKEANFLSLIKNP